MISWQDLGIVLSTVSHGERYKIVNILTQNHGKVRALAYKSKSLTFINLAKVDIAYTSREPDSFGFWRLLSEAPTLVASMHLGNHLLVCQSICFILDKLLPQNADDAHIFKLTDYVSTNLQHFNSVDILFLYVYFELYLLANIGFNTNISNLPITDDYSDIPTLLSSIQFRQRAYRLLQTSSQIIAKNLTNIENFYRSSIARQLSELWQVAS